MTGTALEEAIKNAADTQKFHQYLINKTAMNAEAAPDAASRRAVLQGTGNMFDGGVAGVAAWRSAYWSDMERSYFQGKTPGDLRGSAVPIEAVVWSVYSDMADTEQKWRAVLSQEKLQGEIRKVVATTAIGLIAESALRLGTRVRNDVASILEATRKLAEEKLPGGESYTVALVVLGLFVLAFISKGK